MTKISVRCDSCGFIAFVDETRSLSENGWSLSKGAQSATYCPECAEKLQAPGPAGLAGEGARRTNG